MRKNRKNRHPSETGKRLNDAILAKYNSVADFARDLSEEPDIGAYDTILSTLSNMINGSPINKWNRKYFLPMERKLDVRIADITDGTKGYKSSPRGLYEIGTYGTYKDFELFAEQTDGSIEVIHSSDEWSNGILDYVLEAKNLDGLRYLVDNDFYQVFRPGELIQYHSRCTDKVEHALKLLNVLAEDDDPTFKMFKKLFDTRESTDLAFLDPNLFENERVLDLMINKDRLLQAVCRKPEIVPESKLNRTKRLLKGDEYQAICASNWLTPLLCYALKNEDKYRSQAMVLMDTSLQVATDTLANIGKNISTLGGTEESITTEKGHVILGHNYVIGVIGEPSTKGEIKDPELNGKANEIAAKIGVFRAMAKFQTPVLLDGKMHMPRFDLNPLYRTFIKTAKGKAFLLQESDEKGLDPHNYVFEAPKGSAARTNLSLKQWEQVGKALKSIHSIDCGQAEKSYCHGKFSYSDFYLLPNGDLELITGYKNVYIGDPEEDVFAMGFAAFNNSYFQQEPQYAIEAFLNGYGYPSDGFLEKLWDYLVDIARKEDNMGEARYILDSAATVLTAIKKRNQVDGSK